MPTRLYLDSARMGLLSERARLAHLDFARLAATEGCSLYFSQFLERGFQDWPESIQERYPALWEWQGVRELQDALVTLLGARQDCRVLLANRTAQLVRLAVRQLCEDARRVLVADSVWPSYRRILEFERHRRRVGISTVCVRAAVRDSGETTEKIVSRFEQNYDRMGCDGLFIPVISHDGLRLPVDIICRRLNQIRPLQFVAVDGAQAFGHVTDELGLDHCDILVAGCHKWLQGHLPMGVAFLPNSRSSETVVAGADRMLRHVELDDPLLSFTRELLTSRTQAYAETVNVAPLFTCRAAISERGSVSDHVAAALRQRLHNAERVKRIATPAGWRPLPDTLPTGIVMLQADCPSVRVASSDWTRRFFAAHSVSVSTFENGIIRLAMPDRPLLRGELDLLAWSLRNCWVADEPSASVDELERMAAANAV